jgi:hypothetical protein
MHADDVTFVIIGDARGGGRSAGVVEFTQVNVGRQSAAEAVRVSEG